MDNSVSCSERITQVLRVIQEVFEFYGFRSEGYSLAKTQHHWNKWAQQCGWIAWTKYKLAAFFAVQLSQTELPKCPVVGSDDAPAVLLGGIAGRWVRKYLREADHSSRYSFLASVLYAKYGMPLPSDADCKAEEKATQEFLTQLHPELCSVSSWMDDEQKHPVFPRPLFGGRDERLDPGFHGPAARACTKLNPRSWAATDKGFQSDPYVVDSEEDYAWQTRKLQDRIPLSVTRQDVYRALERTVDELFPPVEDAMKARRLWEEEVKPLHPRFPSTNGNYNRGRAKGGAVGDVHAVAAEVGLIDPVDPLVQGRWVAASAAARVKREARRLVNPARPRALDEPVQGDVESMAHYRRQLQRLEDTVPARSKHSRDYDSSEDESRGNLVREHVPVRSHDKKMWLASIADDESDDFRPVGPKGHITPASVEGLTYLVDDSALVAKSDKLWTAVLERAMHEHPFVETVGLAEALKVRVITKGPPLTYAALKPIQEYLHSTLRKHPCFSLIGEEISTANVHMRMTATLRDDEFYLSGDYKASTNLLDPQCSETVVRRICRNLQFPQQYEVLMLRSLTGHVFISEHDDGSASYDSQLWGQLMGSIDSFPILCIVNAALSRWAVEYGRKQVVRLIDAPLMINGDDVLIKTNVYGLWAWRSLTAFAGLQPSVGKVYTSREYLNMNSTSFRRIGPELGDTIEVPDRDDPRALRTLVSPFSRIPFVNLRLLTANSRSMAVGDIGVKEMPLGARARELMRTCPFGLREVVWKKFLNRNWKKLSSVRVPWYMPEWLGGLGLPWLLNYSTDDVDDVAIVDSYGPTDVDLRKAHGIRIGWSQKRPLKPVPAASWAVHERVMESLPVQPWETTKPVDTAGYDRLYGRLACETLLRSEKLSDLQLSAKSIGQHVLRHNERLWLKAPYLSPLTLKDVRPIKSYTFLPVTFV